MTKPTVTPAKANTAISNTEDDKLILSAEEKQWFIALLNKALKRKDTVTQDPSGKDEAVIDKSNKDYLYMVAKAMGSCEGRFTNAQINYLLGVVHDGTNASGKINNTMALLQAIGPQNELEGMLAVQMVATQHVSMTMLRKSVNPAGLTREEAAYYPVRAHKAQQMFLQQLEMLHRLRTGGQTVQKVVVERVEVNSGGQAVVGVVTGGPGEKKKTEV